MAYFQTKNRNLGKLWRVLYVKDIGIFYGHLVYFSRFGMLYPEKSGNPDVDWRSAASEQKSF
jgi:hypothetical protein